jgi:hypothetical protein
MIKKVLGFDLVYGKFLEQNLSLLRHGQEMEDRPSQL